MRLVQPALDTFPVFPCELNSMVNWVFACPWEQWVTGAAAWTQVRRSIIAMSLARSEDRCAGPHLSTS